MDVGWANPWVGLGLIFIAFSDTHESIWIVFGRNVTEEVGNIRRHFIFPPRLTSAYALLDEMQKHKIASFRSDAEVLHCHASTGRWLNSVLLLVTHAHAAI